MKNPKMHKAIVSQIIIYELLNKVCGNYTNFKANEQFYTGSGINCRRWAKLYRGELSITVCELMYLCCYFRIAFSPEEFVQELRIIK